MPLFELFKSITTLVFDVDGVLTDGLLTLLPGGVMARSMNAKDGYGLGVAVRRGYHLIIISGGASEEVTERLNKLGIIEVHMKVSEKLGLLSNLLEKAGRTWAEVMYMGDDVPDLPCMQKAALACCPLDAVQEIKDVSAYISPLNGGRACARDVIEKVLRSRGDWNDDPHTPST